MAEEIQNIFDDVVELKKLNPWLAPFALTDNEVKAIIKLISKIIIGSADIKNFYSEMKKVIRKDDSMVKKITISAIEKRLLPIKDRISGVEEALAELGRSAASEIKTELPKNDSNLNTSISFSPDDDEEIKQIISNIDSSAKVYDYTTLAELIISESGYSLDGDEVMFSRLKNIIIARLKDIRDEIETIEALKKSRKIGGLEMDDQQAKKIVALAKSKIDQGLLSKIGSDLNGVKPISFPTKKPFTRGKISLDVKKTIDNKQPISLPKKVEEMVIEKTIEKPIKQQPIHTELIIEEEDGLPVIKFPHGDDLMVKPKMVNLDNNNLFPKINHDLNTDLNHDKFTSVKKVETPKSPVVTELKAVQPEIKQNIPVPQPQPMPQSSLPPKNIRFGKKLVDGVRVGGGLVGPVEELSTMTLINFRRLGETPHKATAKIKQKIELLENDSYAKRLEGIDAWHKSEVNRFYRLLGQESMRQERGIDDIINERMQDGKPTLSIEEFNSVMELNKDLRY